MSNKKHTQKHEAQKPDAEIAIDATIEQEEPTAEDVAMEQAAPEDSQGDQPIEPAAPEQAAEPETDVAEQPAVIETVAAESAPQAAAATAVDIATRLTKTVTAIAPTGKPEDVHALHKVEMLVGDLKTSLPAAIKAMDGDQLGADLLGLLASL